MTPNLSENSGSNDSSKALSFGGGWGEVDVNCDMGEGMDNDALIMPFISSVNVSCGYHAGDENTIWKTIEQATKHRVAVGAHVSFFDKENFGRSEIALPAGEVYDLVTQQLIIIKEIADSFPVKLNHVKPHGALYNMAAKDAVLAKTIASAIKDFDKHLVLFGLSGSYSINQAKAIGLRTANEVFADRTYRDDGSLTPRSEPNALIEDPDKSVQQVLQMIKQHTVTTIKGKTIPIVAETICIHGDGKHAAAFARNIFENLKQNNIAIKAV